MTADQGVELLSADQGVELLPAEQGVEGSWWEVEVEVEVKVKRHQAGPLKR